MHDRTEWERVTTGTVRIKGKEYKNLVEFRRPCQSCGELFSVYVTGKIANGHADSNSFGLKNCDKHRRNKTGAENDEVETLRTANATMAEELRGLYERGRLQFEEIQVLKAKLAVYELAPAMAAVGCETVQNTKSGSLTFPWQQE